MGKLTSLITVIVMGILTQGPLTLSAFIVGFAPWVSGQAFARGNELVAWIVVAVALLAAGLLVYRISILVQAWRREQRDLD